MLHVIARSRIVNRCSRLFKQFPPVTAARLALSRAVVAFADFGAVLTYGQAGDDRVIETLLGDISPGYYVDIGANHPFQKSNTLRLYERGWCGLVVDANPDLVRLFRRARPRDTAACAVVSDREGDVTFEICRDPALSKVRSGAGGDGLASGGVVTSISAKAQTLATLFEQYEVPSDFDLLSIDVEGHDLQVLKSFEINRYRPRLIVIEIAENNCKAALSNPVTLYLSSFDYVLVGFAARNAYFLAS